MKSCQKLGSQGPNVKLRRQLVQAEEGSPPSQIADERVDEEVHSATAEDVIDRPSK